MRYSGIILGMLLSFPVFAGSSIFNYERYHDADIPHITMKEERVLGIARDAAYQTDGELCALSITYGHPSIVDIDDKRTWTVPTTMVAAMLTQNASTCVCIGEYGATVAESVPPQYRSRQNIRALLFNVIANSALRHRAYYAWEDMEGIDAASQRFMVERIVNACTHAY